jgi:D-glucuronyl C5-epimerase C-terminus
VHVRLQRIQRPIAARPGVLPLCAAALAAAVGASGALLAPSVSGAAGPAPESHRSGVPTATLLVLEPGGRTQRRKVPIVAPAAIGPQASVQAPPASSRSRAKARTSAVRGLTVAGALLRLRRGGAITRALYNEYYSQYRKAVESVKRLRGTRYTELAAVLTNVEQMAAAGSFSASRLPVIFLTLENNRKWWTTGPLLSADQRVSFPESRLVWEYYPGQGIEIQWLGTFGEANGYYLSGHQDTALKELLEEAIPLATQRADGIAWEYLFHFDGGAPPWTSGLSQGTALQVLARAYARFHEPEFLTAAQGALGIFRVAPSTGVRLATRPGAWYVQYTYAPHDRILNGFIQALVGLYEYTKLTGDPTGQSLFEAGDAEARARVRRYDTGAWSRYDQFSESSLSYHELLTEFLVHLCERTEVGLPLSPAAQGTKGAPRTPIPGDQVYCTTASRFKTDLHTPPSIALVSRRLTTGTRAGVQVSLSKIATVTLTIRQGARVLASNTATVEAGTPKLLWVTPRAPGTYSVSLRAVDLAGNSATASGSIALVAGRS